VIENAGALKNFVEHAFQNPALIQIIDAILRAAGVS
jgi:hypothetical protein